MLSSILTTSALYENTHSRKELLIIKNEPHAEYLIRNNKQELVRAITAWFGKTLQ